MSSFKRAEELATAMECRCYRGDKNRTKLVKLSYHGIDFAWFMASALFIGAIITLRIIPAHIQTEISILKMLFYVI